MTATAPIAAPANGAAPAAPAPEPKTSALYKALAEAKDRAEAVAKSSQGERYGKYASTEHILEAVREASKGLGLSWRSARCPIHRAPDGRALGITRVIAFSHESGETVESSMDWSVDLIPSKDGRPTRSEEKSIAAAQTASLGYILRDAFALPRLKEEEMDARDREAAAAEPDALAAMLNEVVALAKARIGAGYTRAAIVAGLRRAAGRDDVITDAAEWTAKVDETAAAAMLKAIKASPAEPTCQHVWANNEATRWQWACSLCGSLDHPSRKASAPAAPAASTAPPAATAAPAPAAGQADLSEPVPRAALDQLSAAVGGALAAYGTTKPAMVALLRGWAGDVSVVGDDGRFQLAVTKGQYGAMVNGFRAWEAGLRQKGGAPAPVDRTAAADAARAEWEAAGQPAGGPAGPTQAALQLGDDEIPF